MSEASRNRTTFKKGTKVERLLWYCNYVTLIMSVKTFWKSPHFLRVKDGWLQKQKRGFCFNYWLNDSITPFKNAWFTFHLCIQMPYSHIEHTKNACKRKCSDKRCDVKWEKRCNGHHDTFNQTKLNKWTPLRILITCCNMFQVSLICSRCIF